VKLIDKYIFREWFKAFLLTFCAIMMAVLLGVMYDDLHHLIDFGATTSEIIRFFFVLLPSFLPIIMPVALLMSVLFTLGTMHRNNEIIAMRASGFNFFDITRSLWVSAAVLALGLFYLNADLIPWSIEEAHKIEDQIKYGKVAEEQGAENVGLVTRVAFENKSDNRLWYINRFSQYTQHGYGVNVYQRDASGKEDYRIMAREAYYDNASKEWVFKNGRKIVFDGEDPIQSIPFDEKRVVGFDESSEVIAALNKKPRHLSLRQIGSILKTLDYKDNIGLRKYAIKYHAILATPISCLIVLSIAIPFAISGVRANPLVGVSKAIVLFFLYYFIVNMAGIMGSKEILSPFLAAWIPHIFVIGIAILAYRKLFKS